MTRFFIILSFYLLGAILTTYWYGKVDPEPWENSDTPDGDLVGLFWPLGILVVAYYAGNKRNPNRKEGGP